jgi:hypothetical protein
MKKLLAALALLLLPTGAFGQDIYQASVDFAGTQGVRGWFYQNSDGTLMTFDSATNRWKGPETYLEIWADGGHPGMVLDSVRRWVAPQSGSIRVTGQAYDQLSDCGGGVIVYIRKNGTTLWQQAIANGNAIGFPFDVSTTVVAGDAIDFVVNKGPDGNWDCDWTGFDPHIALTPDGPPAPPHTLTIGWVEPTTSDCSNFVPTPEVPTCPTALDDLSRTYVTFQLGAGSETNGPSVPASNVGGGAPVTTTLTLNAIGPATIRVYAQDLTGNISLPAVAMLTLGAPGLPGVSVEAVSNFTPEESP